MKSLVFIGSILFSFFIFFTPVEVFSQSAPTPPVENSPTNDQKPTDGFSLQESGFIPPKNLPTFNLGSEQSPVSAFETILLNYIINPIFMVSGGVAVIVILYSSFRLITSRAQEDAITAAKTTLIWAFVGLALVMLSYTIVSNLAKIILEVL